MNKEKTTEERKAEFDKQTAELTEASAPLRKWLSENQNPHAIAIVTSTSVEILHGAINIPDLNEFIKD